ncbi:ATP-dependent protease ClpP protease subunit [Bradyrhizobium sp. USDA 4524]|uniref:ATP-dependent Clp protease proteolytic subunit n=1 Tax=unclassified Bradyrhizobium TaxID=2631580 RepID=UPI0020A03E03|nr:MULTISPECIES: ATP-dependent Clp protease proteolytic subunit [unclassified Bradyrhizobium]MCP1844416.1 ATP-dependent protease ClpP protease subunit [Bradyrhizobium sp. USDA 4538]MCP1904982.1 ATP-dependent protease ClpP protease subunit [Bradyrhizobium sp. USDA 4537]MCP1989362.1 ATP-dependent protease ClpP protease subunit [Bradyrhizobium sp. USDA 4539]
MSETLYQIRAIPRCEPKPLPAFPGPGFRPEGVGPPLRLALFSPVRDGVEIALGRVPERDTSVYLRAIREAGNRGIRCLIDCAGGDGDEALLIARALLAHPYRVECQIVGRCSSAAVMIALAADHRSIVADGTVLIHRSMRLAVQSQFDAMRMLPAAEKDAINASLNDVDDAIASLLVTRLGVAEQTARQWMLEDRQWSATEALECGFADAINIGE